MKWISVKDRKPQDDIKVLIWAIGSHASDEGHLFMGSYSHIEDVCEDWFTGDCDFGGAAVTHWAYLPDPPKDK